MSNAFDCSGRARIQKEWFECLEQATTIVDKLILPRWRLAFDVHQFFSLFGLTIKPEVSAPRPSSVLNISTTSTYTIHPPTNSFSPYILHPV